MKGRLEGALLAFLVSLPAVAYGQSSGASTANNEKHLSCIAAQSYVAALSDSDRGQRFLRELSLGAKYSDAASVEMMRLLATPSGTKIGYEELLRQVRERASQMLSTGYVAGSSDQEFLASLESAKKQADSCARNLAREGAQGVNSDYDQQLTCAVTHLLVGTLSGAQEGEIEAGGNETIDQYAALGSNALVRAFLTPDGTSKGIKIVRAEADAALRSVILEEYGSDVSSAALSEYIEEAKSKSDACEKALAPEKGTQS